MSIIKHAIYRHCKGKHYQVLLSNVCHSETLEKMVVYRQLYGDFREWTRPQKMFEEEIAHKKPRFQFICKYEIEMECQKDVDLFNFINDSFV